MAEALTADEALTDALDHYEQGSRWLVRGAGLPPSGHAAEVAAAGSMAAGHFAAGKLALALAAPPEGPEPLCPPLDEHGHLAGGADGFDMWQMAAWLPIGREQEVFGLLAANGIEVYRAWKARQE